MSEAAAHQSTPPSPVTDRIIGFIVEVGIAVTEADLPESTFLPGILIDRGTLRVDRARLRYPGDLLHEAGHLAVLTPAIRRVFGTSEGPTGIDMRQLEVQAFAWSYAAALHLTLDPAVVFHEGGYGGRSASLLQNFALGVFFGVSGLLDAGMTVSADQSGQLGVPAYPHMRKWLRD